MIKGFFKKEARGKPCLIRVAPVAGLSCASQETTVLCHVSLAGLKAMGSRKAGAPDVCGAWGCHICHGIVDGQIKTDLQPQTVRLYHFEGVARTLDALVKARLLPNP